MNEVHEMKPEVGKYAVWHYDSRYLMAQITAVIPLRGVKVKGYDGYIFNSVTVLSAKAGKKLKTEIDEFRHMELREKQELANKWNAKYARALRDAETIGWTIRRLVPVITKKSSFHGVNVCYIHDKRYVWLGVDNGHWDTSANRKHAGVWSTKELAKNALEYVKKDVALKDWKICRVKAKRD